MNVTPSKEKEMSPESSMSPELTRAIDLAGQAGEILKKYHGTSFNVRYKKDIFDPVTIADKESDELLRGGISSDFPSDSILSEESPLQPSSYEGRVWMIDPLDDTKGYIAGRDTAGVMIGLAENGKPILGVVYLPFRDEWYYAEADKGAFRNKDGITTQLHVRSVLNITDSVLVGRNLVHGDVRPMDNVVSQLGFKGTIPEGCIGAKIGLIARGSADAFIHTNLKAGKWDTLAAQTILTEAGGVMCDIDGNELDYTKPDSGWNRYFMAACTPELLEQIVERLKTVNEQTHAF
jgi:3'(2'), 5'-bisphosphate nucleotidase